MTTQQGTHLLIPMSQLTPSPLNHRKHYDKSKMDELAASIRVQGVIQPILARPLNAQGDFEVVAGERRYRAAKAIGLEEIPAIVRQLDDAQALELQVIENNQRVDPHPLEEAEGYEALLKVERAGGQPYTADEIAEKIGKSRAYVYGRLKLLALCEKGRKAMRDDKLNASIGLLIARIPSESQQVKCLEEVLAGPHGFGGPMSYRDAQRHIEARYMLRLKEAPFKTSDAELVPDAGACTSCPKRTGNQPELFADVKSDDTCTDSDCYQTKIAAYGTRKREEAIASGVTVIHGKEAAKVMPHEHATPKGFVKLDALCHDDPKGRTYRALLGKLATKATLIEIAPGKFVDVMKKADVDEALEKKGYKFLEEKELQKKQDQKEREREEIKAEARVQTYLALREAIAKDGLGPDDLRMLIVDILDYDSPDERLLRIWTGKDELPEDLDLQAIIAAAPNEQLVPMLLDAVIRDPRHINYAKNEPTWAPLAKLRGIDAKEIERDVKAEFKAKAKAKPAEHQQEQVEEAEEAVA